MLQFDWIYSYIWQSGTWVEDMIDPMLMILMLVSIGEAKSRTCHVRLDMCRFDFTRRITRRLYAAEDHRIHIRVGTAYCICDIDRSGALEPME